MVCSLTHDARDFLKLNLFKNQAYLFKNQALVSWQAVIVGSTGKGAFGLSVLDGCIPAYFCIPFKHFDSFAGSIVFLGETLHQLSHS